MHTLMMVFRRVQSEAVVPLPPIIADAPVALDEERRNAHLPEPRGDLQAIVPGPDCQSALN